MEDDHCPHLHLRAPVSGMEMGAGGGNNQVIKRIVPILFSRALTKAGSYNEGWEEISRSNNTA